MNRIVRQHYPVEKLPPELREGLDASAQVTIIVEAEPDPDEASPISLEQIFAMREPPFLTKEEIDRDLKKQRDEWE
ncbi:MAG: hypothetical protein RL735_2030 [Pseudomonadota bacterium]|jgi:hypothetical protein